MQIRFVDAIVIHQHDAADARGSTVRKHRAAQTAHSNPLVDLFIKGGPVMWPILAVSIVAFTVIAERIIWWSREKRQHEPE